MAIRNEKAPNGSISTSSSRGRQVKRRGFFSRLISIALRLSIWYTLLTVVFRCPSSPKQLTKDSPNVCEPYFQLRDFAVPHLQPYYNTYAAPYVQQAQPYFDRVKDQAYVPAAAFAQKHGAPRAAQVQAYATKEWKRSVRPQLDVARKHALKQYDSTLGPHVQKVQDAVSPYYTNVKASASDFYELELLPAYKHTAPYAKKFYGQAHRFSVNTALPYARWGTDLTFTFVRRQIWPRIQVLYGENVEPQIFKITQRLGRYRDEKKIEAAVESAESSASSSSSSVSSASSASSIVVSSSPSAVVSSASSVVESIMTKASSVVVASPSMAPTEEEPSAAEQFSQDLKVWEEHVSIAVREGLDHLRERINEICDRQVETQTNGVGEALIIQLEESSSSAFRSLKARVETVIERLPEEPSESDISSAQDTINKEVKKAGQTIKQKAQNVRDWKQTFDKDITRLIEAAANSTLETIDNIRDLRLQEIGRRWASNAAITHRDWTKYNDLKKASSKGRDEVAALATSSELTEAKKSAQSIEDRAMAVAEGAAKELARLKSVSQWKLEARDSSDDFNTKYAPAAAAWAKQQVADKISAAKEAVAGSSQGTVDSATSVLSSQGSQVASSMSSQGSQAASSMSAQGSLAASSISSQGSQMASSASEAILGTSTGSVKSAASKVSEKVLGSEQPTVESIISVVSESAKSAATIASESVLGTQPGVAEQAATKVSEAVVGRDTPVIESISSAASSVSSRVADQSLDPEMAKSLKSAKSSVVSFASDASSSVASVASSVSAPSIVSEASSSISSVAQQGSSSASSVASQVSESASDVSAQASKKVWGGAMAQAVPSARSIVLDDDIVDDENTYSSKLQDILGKAGSQASQLTQAVQDALKPAPTQGSVESVTSLASEQYERALSAASSVIFGTEQGVGESLSSVASDRYASAVSAASSAIYGEPIPATKSVASQVASVAASITAGASSNVDSFQSQASSIYTEVQSAYSSSIADPLQSVYSNSIADPVQSALSSISSIASSRLQEGLSSASAQFEHAKSAVGASPTPVQQGVLADAQRRYYEMVGYAYDRYSAFESAGRDMVATRPTSTSGYSNVLAAAQSQYSSAVNAASSNMDSVLSSARSVVSGTTQSPAQSLIDQASSHYDAATSSASSYLVIASSKASEAIYGTQPAMYENLLASAQSQYDAAYSAASSNLNNILESANSNAGPALDSAFEQYELAVSAAGEQFSMASVKASGAIYGTSTRSVESIASAASTAIYGSETPWTEAAASQASENWEMLVSKASEQVYGSPTPFFSQAGEYASQATVAVVEQYAAVSALFDELVNGREPEFTESVWNRLQSAYSTGAPAIASSASSYAQDAYASASSFYESAFTPPPTVEALLDNVNEQINSAVDAVSAQIYGTTKGNVEQMTEAVGSAYNDVASRASEAVYGTTTGYAEAAQSQISDAASSAQQAISEALFGTPSTAAAASIYTSIASVASENRDAVVSKAVEQYEAATSAASSAIYGSEKGAFESAQSRLSVAMASASSRLAEFGETASKATDDSVSKVVEAAQEAASSASSVAESVSARVRDEL
ncbi:unnamed protein product [Aureobasidium uvarum]|uniref:Uncharacterized protein n=1 Tax=Aureobasidium uvarum TaxID=2773716 RepID=A0A9N8K7Q0_9PEZI|nr:unnamed protein product [Aureobasidium uvarum]